MKLTDSMNTYNPALGLIIDRGYKIVIIDKDDSFDWVAKSDENEFIASDPLRLLALILLKEEKQELWNIYERNFYDEILKDFYGE